MLGVDTTSDPTIWERFASKIDYGPTHLDCWNWDGATVAAKNSPWYKWGVMRAFGKAHKASRVSWMLNRGPIPQGMNVLHMCNNPLCVNAGHLYLGTQRENVQDMDRQGRRVNAPLRGAQHPNAKFSSEHVQLMRKSELSASEIARILNATPEHVRNVRAGRQRRSDI